VICKRLLAPTSATVSWPQFENRISEFAVVARAGSKRLGRTSWPYFARRVSAPAIGLNGPDLYFGSMPNAVKALDLQPTAAAPSMHPD
jgi:hypothetical protein